MSEPFLKPDERVRYILPRKETRHMGAVVIHPNPARFAFQSKTEKIYILARKHFVTNAGWIFRTFFWLLFPFLTLIILSYIYPDLLNTQTNGDLFPDLSVTSEAALILLYYSLVLSYAWTKYISWFNNVYLITNERMIHTHFRLLTGTTITEAALDKIVDISQESYGLLPSIFNYGNVKVQTATAMKSKFDFNNIPDPAWFRSVLYELVKMVNGEEP